MKLWFALLICLLPLSLYAEGEMNYPISWAAAPGAGGYVVEVQNDHQIIVLNQTVTETSINLKLYPGTYRFRLTTLNRFKRAESTSQWFKFQVLAPLAPSFVAIIPDSFQRGKASDAILRVTDFSRAGSVTLRSPGGENIDLGFELNDTAQLQLHIPALVEVGQYSLILTNPPQQSATVAAVLTVNYPPAVVNNLEPEHFAANQIPSIIHLTGKDFSPVSTVTLEFGGKTIALTVKTRNDSELELALPKTMAVGEYQLILQNTPDASPNDALILTVDPKPRPIAKVREHDLQISLDWMMQSPFGRWERIFEPSVKGLALGFDYYLTPNRRQAKTARFNVGVRLDIAATEFNTKPQRAGDLADSEMDTLSLGAALLLEVTWPSFKIRLYPGAGLAYSSINGGDQFGNWVWADSVDYLAFLRLNLDWPISKTFGIYAEIGYRHLFMPEPIDSISIGAGLNLKFAAY